MSDKARDLLEDTIVLAMNSGDSPVDAVHALIVKQLRIKDEEIERLSNEAKLWKTEWEQITETARQMQVRIKVLEEELLKCINWIEKVTKALEPLPSAPKEEK